LKAYNFIREGVSSLAHSLLIFSAAFYFSSFLIKPNLTFLTIINVEIYFLVLNIPVGGMEKCDFSQLESPFIQSAVRELTIFNQGSFIRGVYIQIY